MLLGSGTALLRMSHVLLGKIVGRYELGMEVQSRRRWDAGRRLGHDKGFKSIFPPSQKLLLRSRATSVSALFFMNVSSPSAPAMLLFQRPEQTNVYVKNFFLISVWLSDESKKKKKKKKGEKTKTKSQISHWSKASSINKSQQIDVALLQDFSVWVCKAALFAIPLCCWKNTPWKQDSWYGMVFQCIVTIFLSDSCLAGCPKLTFWIQCEKLYLLWM